MSNPPRPNRRAMSRLRTAHPRRAALGPASAAHTGRGFTLMELVVVGAVSSVLFLLLLRWVLTLGTASSATLDSAAAQRDADLARDAFASDVSRAAPCAAGDPSPLREITPAKISFTVPDQADPTTVNLVTWQVADTDGTSTLERTIRRHLDGSSNPCRFNPDPTTVTTYAARAGAVAEDQILNGDTSHAPAFYVLNHGNTIADPTQAWGTCSDATRRHELASGLRCSAREVGINWLILAPTDRAAPIPVTRTYQFASTGGALL